MAVQRCAWPKVLPLEGLSAPGELLPINMVVMTIEVQKRHLRNPRVTEGAFMCESSAACWENRWSRSCSLAASIWWPERIASENETCLAFYMYFSGKQMVVGRSPDAWAAIYTSGPSEGRPSVAAKGSIRTFPVPYTSSASGRRHVDAAVERLQA